MITTIRWLTFSWSVVVFCAAQARAEQTPLAALDGEIRVDPKLSIAISPEVLVAHSEAGERRWGVHQFPALSRLPDGSILIMYADARDAFETHGRAAPAYVSHDSGASWQPYAGDLTVIRPHFSVSEVFDGEFLVGPAAPYLDIQADNISLPPPISETKVYGRRFQYALADFSEEIQTRFAAFQGRRYDPQTDSWLDETIRYDIQDRLLFRNHNSNLLPQTFFERALLRHNGELLYADYRAQYRMEDGIATKKGISSCMASRDNGRSFQRRGTIAADRRGNDLKGEPCLSTTADGRLICVLRQTDHVQKPMQLTWSDDGGRTWDRPEDLFEFGVWPCVSLVGGQTLALSFGRPGVWLSFAADGSGDSWSDPTPIIVGDGKSLAEHSCGYTSQLPLDDVSFLLAYSDFQHPHPEGGVAKAIKVRRVTVVRTTR